MRTIILAVLLLTACTDSHDPQQSRTETPGSNHTFVEPAPPDIGDVSRHQSCAASPRRALSATEKCQLSALKNDCSRKADCFVTCIGSPDGIKAGGGCFHVCGHPVSSGNLPNDFYACK